MSTGYVTMNADDGNYMIINGVRYPVINSWVETTASDGRRRWGIVTEESIPQTEEQPAEPATATVQPQPEYEYIDRPTGPPYRILKPQGN